MFTVDGFLSPDEKLGNGKGGNRVVLERIGGHSSSLARSAGYRTYGLNLYAFVRNNSMFVPGSSRRIGDAATFSSSRLEGCITQNQKTLHATYERFLVRELVLRDIQAGTPP